MSHQSLVSVPAIRNPATLNLLSALALLPMNIVTILIMNKIPHAEPIFNPLLEFVTHIIIPFIPIPLLALIALGYYLTQQSELSDQDYDRLVNYLKQHPQDLQTFKQWRRDHPGSLLLRYKTIGPLCRQIGFVEPASSALWRTLRTIGTRGPHHSHSTEYGHLTLSRLQPEPTIR